MAGDKYGSWARRVCVAIFILLSACFASPCLATVINGWDYNISTSTLQQYNVGNFTYYSDGRIHTFTTNSGSGYVYYSNLQYDSNGNVAGGLMSVYGISSVEGMYTTFSVLSTSQQQTLLLQSINAAKQTAESAQKVAGATVLRSERRAVETMLYDRLRLNLLQGYIGKPSTGSSAPLTGRSSGDAAPGLSPVWSMWIDGSITSAGNSITGMQNSMLNYIGLVGVECAPTERLIIGLSTGYSQADTIFHSTYSMSQHDYGFIINPYIGYSPIDNLLLSVQGGMTFTNTSVSGSTTFSPWYGTTLPLSLDNNYSVFTASVGADVSYAIVLDRLVITPHVGYSYSSRQPDSSAVRGLEQGMFSAGGMIGYNWDKLTPFVSASYNYDTIGQTRLQREDMLGSAGLTYRPTDRFQATATVTNAFFRDREYETSYGLNLRYTF